MSADEDFEIELLLDIKAIAIWLLGLVIAILAYIGKRHIDKLDDLKENAATKEELRLLQDGIHDALDELRQDRRSNHEENQQKLDRVLDKIDENEKRNSVARHDTLNTIHAIDLKVAVLTRKHGDG